jgi:CRP-like cAMP-binding protein
MEVRVVSGWRDKLEKRSLNNEYIPLEMAPEQRAEMLEGSRWARDLNWSLTQQLAKFMGAYKMSKGATLFRQGECSQFLLVILEGEVSISKEDTAGVGRQIATLGPNRVLGEMGLLDGQARSATAKATKDCVVLVLTSVSFDNVQEKFPKLWGVVVHKIAVSISRKLRATSGQLVDYR